MFTAISGGHDFYIYVFWIPGINTVCFFKTITSSKRDKLKLQNIYF